MAAYGDMRVLVVSDLFNKSSFYKEYELDFSITATPDHALLSAEFINQNQLRVKFLGWGDQVEVTKTIDLNAAEDPDSLWYDFTEKVGRNYKIVESIENEEPAYHCSIFGNDGRILFEETYQKEPDFSVTNEVTDRPVGTVNSFAQIRITEWRPAVSRRWNPTR